MALFDRQKKGAGKAGTAPVSWKPAPTPVAPPKPAGETAPPQTSELQEPQEVQDVHETEEPTVTENHERSAPGPSTASAALSAYHQAVVSSPPSVRHETLPAALEPEGIASPSLPGYRTRKWLPPWNSPGPAHALHSG